MNLEYLNDFVTLAYVGNFHDAADRLFISQSSLSKHIKSLEAELGVKLFERNTHQVIITEFGTTLLPNARKILEIQFNIEKDIQNLKHTDEKPTIVVGNTPVIPLYKFTNQITNFLQHFKYNIKIVNNDSSTLKTMLLQSKCDFIITYNYHSSPTEYDDSEFEALPYTRDYLAVLLPSAHPLAKRESISFSEIKDETFVNVGKDTIADTFMLSQEILGDFSPQVGFQVDTASQMLGLVTRGLAISLLSVHSFKHFQDTSIATSIAVIPVSPSVPLYGDLLLPKNAKPSNATRTFLDYFKNNFSPENKSKSTT